MTMMFRKIAMVHQYRRNRNAPNQGMVIFRIISIFVVIMTLASYPKPKSLQWPYTPPPP